LKRRQSKYDKFMKKIATEKYHMYMYVTNWHINFQSNEEIMIGDRGRMDGEVDLYSWQKIRDI